MKSLMYSILTVAIVIGCGEGTTEEDIAEKVEDIESQTVSTPVSTPAPVKKKVVKKPVKEEEIVQTAELEPQTVEPEAQTLVVESEETAEELEPQAVESAQTMQIAEVQQREVAEEPVVEEEEEEEPQDEIINLRIPDDYNFCPKFTNVTKCSFEFITFKKLADGSLELDYLKKTTQWDGSFFGDDIPNLFEFETSYTRSGFPEHVITFYSDRGSQYQVLFVYHTDTEEYSIAYEKDARYGISIFDYYKLERY